MRSHDDTKNRHKNTSLITRVEHALCFPYFFFSFLGFSRGRGWWKIRDQKISPSFKENETPPSPIMLHQKFFSASKKYEWLPEGLRRSGHEKDKCWESCWWCGCRCWREKRNTCRRKFFSPDEGKRSAYLRKLMLKFSFLRARFHFRNAEYA